MPLVGYRILHTFGDFFSGWSTLRLIREAFEAQGLQPRPGSADDVSGERRQLAFEYYRALDLEDFDNASALLRVFAAVLSDLEEEIERGANHPDAGQGWLNKLNRRLVEQGLAYESGRITGLTAPATSNRLVTLAREMNLDALARQLNRLADSAEDDPEQAIGTSKEVLETVCKTILGERGVQVGPKWDFTKLESSTRRALDLLGTGVPDSKKGSASIKKALSSIGNIANSVNELTALYGTGHGRDGRARGVSPRHARLAVGMATTLATFLIETHLERGN